MTLKKKQVGLLATAVAASLLATACSSGGGGSSASPSSVNFAGTPSGTLQAWAFNGADDVGKARMEFVANALKGVSIKYNYAAFDAQKFTTQLASGNVPDVVQMDAQLVPTYAAQGLIMPLDKCYSENSVNPDQRFYPAVAANVTYQGHIWAVPQFYQPNAILLNEKVMQAAGVTDSEINTSKPQELIAAAKKMYKESNGNPSVLGFNAVPTGQYNQWIIGLGGQLSDSSGKPTLNDPANVYPLQLLKEISDAQGGFAKDKSFTDSFDFFGADNQFVKNQVGAEVDAQWYPNVLSPYKDQISLRAVPFMDKNGQPVSVTGGTAFVIPTKAKNPVAACQYALQLSTTQNWVYAEKARLKTLAQNHGVNTGLFTGNPQADKLIEKKYVKSSGNADFDQVIKTFYDVLPHAKPLGASPANQAIQQALLNAVTATLLGQQSPQQALDQAQQQAMNAYNSVTNQ